MHACTPTSSTLMTRVFGTVCVAAAFVALAAPAQGVEKKGTSQHLWRDTELTTQLWRLCSSGNTAELEALIEDKPEALTARAGDGRGPLWWAFENKQDKVVALLLGKGASPDEQDADGKKPDELTNGVGLTAYAKALLEQKRREVEEMDAGITDEGDDFEDGYDD